MTARGGKRPGAGRKPGAPNKSTQEIKSVAREYGPAAVRELAKLAGLTEDGAGKAESEQARIAALNGVLDRGYGKATQLIGGDDEADPINVSHAGTDELVSRIARLAARGTKGQDPK